MRHPYKMRKVVRKFYQPPRSDPPVMLPKEELECGHVCYDRDDLYGNEKAVQIGALSKAMSGDLGRRRCYDCGRPVEDVLRSE